MKIVVSGASGFLGSWICRVLSTRHEVIALVRPTSSLYRLQGIASLKIAGVEEHGWGSYISNVNASAWISLDWSGVSNRDRNDEAQFQNINRLAKLCDEVSNVPIVIGTGSQAELGPSNKTIYESQADSPTTVYGEAKVQARSLMSEKFEGTATRFVWARIFSTYGALDSNDWLMPATIDALLAGKSMPLTRGEQEWSYLHAFDLAGAFETALNTPSIQGIMNVGNPETVRISDVVKEIGRALNKSDLLGFGELEYREDQVMKLAPACESLTNAGWKPEIALKDGIDHLINWMNYKTDVALRKKDGYDIFLNLPIRN
jgi:nucleoside-diphosphate-sugar epimerase